MLIQRLLPQKQEAQPPGAASLVCRRARPLLARHWAADDPHSRYRPRPPGTSASGANQPETLLRGERVLPCNLLRNPHENAGGPTQPSRSHSTCDCSGLWDTATCTNTKHISTPQLVCWWFSAASSMITFYTRPSSCRVLMACQREAYAFPFPFPFASTDTDKCYWKYFTIFQGR